MKTLSLILLLISAVNFIDACTETTVSGTKRPGNFCSGDLIFEDNFDWLDHEKWWHEATMAGGGNYEFQWYVNDRFNSYTTGGILHLKPTFTSSIFGEAFLTSGRAVIPEWECTDSSNWGCDRTGSYDNIINPIRSARVSTWESFAFKYGTVEIRAKMPAGDWLWPALWLMPKWSVYGGWPRSGEIDLMESRGNRALFAGNTHVGNEQTGSTLHFGPAWNVNAWPTAHATRNQYPGWSEGFHNYKLVWHPRQLQFLVDNQIVLIVDANDGNLMFLNVTVGTVHINGSLTFFQMHR
jgi:beta-glucanase (GH16 family)